MRKKEAGFTLMETMVALVVLLAVSAVVMSGMMQMIKTEGAGNWPGRENLSASAPCRHSLGIVAARRTGSRVWYHTRPTGYLSSDFQRFRHYPCQRPSSCPV